eukprot:9749-Heterococcus_DN1.PRE.1
MQEWLEQQAVRSQLIVLFSRVDAVRLVELDQLMDSITAPTSLNSTASTARSFAALFEKLYAQYGIHTQEALLRALGGAQPLYPLQNAVLQNGCSTTVSRAHSQDQLEGVLLEDDDEDCAIETLDMDTLDSNDKLLSLDPSKSVTSASSSSAMTATPVRRRPSTAVPAASSTMGSSSTGMQKLRAMNSGGDTEPVRQVSALRGSTSGRPTSAFGGLRSVGSSQAMASANAISGSAIGSGTAAANSGQHKSLSSTDSFYRDKKAEQEVIAAQSAHAEALKQTAAVHAAELAEKTCNVQAVEAQLAAAQKELESAQSEETSALALKTELQSRIGDPLAWQKEKDGLELHISTLRSKDAEKTPTVGVVTATQSERKPSWSGTREEATVRRTEAELLRQARLTAMETDCAATVQCIQEQHAQAAT